MASRDEALAEFLKPPPARKYDLSNLPAETSLRTLAAAIKARWGYARGCSRSAGEGTGASLKPTLRMVSTWVIVRRTWSFRRT